jgi:hypothetical protein
MSYIGRGLQSGAFRQLDDISSGFDGSDTTHTMQVNSTNVTVGDVNQILLSLGGVIQKPGTDFTVSSSVLTFTTAPAANTSFFAILLGSDNGGTVTPTDGSVTTAKIVDANVTKAKLADSIDVFAGTSLSAADLGVGVHIKTADASVSSLNSAADELVLENSASCGVSILSGTSEVGKIAFGDSGDNNVGEIFYNHSINEMIFTVNTAETLRLGNSMDISTGGEDAPDVTDGGICLDQGADDLNIMTFKSSDVAHGMTGLAETDTYGKIAKVGADIGGLDIQGFIETGATQAIRFAAMSTDDNTTKSVDGGGKFFFQAYKKSGTSVTAPGSNANILAIASSSNTRFIFDAEGDFHADSSSTTFDEYDDAQLARTFDITHGRGVIESKFDKFISYNHEKLADLQLVGREKDGTPNHFINVTGMQRLHNGAIWQQYEKHQKLAEAVYEMAKEALGEDKADAILKKHDIKLLN